MQNRVLRRHVKKFLQLESETDLVSVKNYLDTLKDKSEILSPQTLSFIEGFDEFFGSLDKAFDEYDRVLKARETSIEIGEAETNRANEVVQQELMKRDAALRKLKDILKKLDVSTESGGDELVELVKKVEGLVRRNIEHSKDLEIIFGLSLRISGSRNLRELSDRLRECVGRLTESPADCFAYFHSKQFSIGKSDRYAHFTDQEAPELRSLGDAYRSGVLALTIETSSQTEPILMVIANPKENSKKWGDTSRVKQLWKALTPAILSTCEVIRFVQEEKQNLKIQADLKMASLVQQNLVPSENLLQSDELQVASWFQAASEVGGDWWGHYHLSDGRHLLLVADVTGHGTASALLTAVVKGYCDSIPTRNSFEPGDFFLEIDQMVAKSFADHQKLLTMAAAIYDPKTRMLSLLNAGHPVPLLLKSSPESDKAPLVELDRLNGPILGMGGKNLKASDFNKFSTTVSKGDKLILYTDGLTEAVSASGQIFTELSLLRVLRMIPSDCKAGLLRDTIREKHKKFLSETPLADDISLIVVEFL